MGRVTDSLPKGRGFDPCRDNNLYPHCFSSSELNMQILNTVKAHGKAHTCEPLGFRVFYKIWRCQKYLKMRGVWTKLGKSPTLKSKIPFWNAKFPSLFMKIPIWNEKSPFGRSNVTLIGSHVWNLDITYSYNSGYYSLYKNIYTGIKLQNLVNS